MWLLLLFLINFHWYFAVYWYPYLDVVSNITFFCWVEALLLCIIYVIIHTIKDAVGIPNYGTCGISRGYRLKRKFPNHIFTAEIIHYWIHEKKACFIYWCSGVCSFWLILALFHLACFKTSIVMLSENQSRPTIICTQISKISTTLVCMFAVWNQDAVWLLP